jgi:glycine dehydrogenase subunit 2
MAKEAGRGVVFDEPLLFELGAEGRSGASLPRREVPPVDARAIFGDAFRDEGTPWPELSEPEVFRHFVRLSEWNFAIDNTFYPLGSCTMKYNPKVNEWAARLSGFGKLHPYSPVSLAQGALELMWRLEKGLAEVCGMDRVSLQPAAGAQGELTGLMMIRAYHHASGRNPKKVLVPDTAHGTNPASCAFNGFETVPFPGTESGTVDPSAIAPLLDDDVAAIMMTNPNTLGLFESNLPQIAAMLHEKGALVYGDGANLNALLGRARPGDLGIDVMQFNLHKTFTTPHGGGGPGCGPVGYKRALDAFAPRPRVDRDDAGVYYFDAGTDASVGRLRSFYGNFGMMVRAYAYLREMGAEGLRGATDMAVLNANYLRKCLGETYDVAIDGPCMHEVVLSDKHLKATGVTTLDVSKRLIDYGFHPPTMYFPLVVKGAMLVEPTETESKQTLDAFVDAMKTISQEAHDTPEKVKGAPHNTAWRRLDETRAARNPVLRWKKPATSR